MKGFFHTGDRLCPLEEAYEGLFVFKNNSALTRA